MILEIQEEYLLDTDVDKAIGVVVVVVVIVVVVVVVVAVIVIGHLKK